MVIFYFVIIRLLLIIPYHLLSGLLDIFIFKKIKDIYRPFNFDKYLGKDHITEEQIYPLKEVERQFVLR